MKGAMMSDKPIAALHKPPCAYSKVLLIMVGALLALVVFAGQQAWSARQTAHVADSRSSAHSQDIVWIKSALERIERKLDR